MNIRGITLAEHAQTAVAPTFLHIAKYLIVGFVFFDDVHHVLEYGRLSYPLRNGHRGHIFTGRRLRICHPVVEGIVVHHAGVTL